jgi:hypothetical protein
MISSMNKNVLFIVLILFGMAVSAQDVRYYKLVHTKIDGVSNKNVSGGQFITFVSDICFESNSKGVGVDHGTLTRNNNYSNAQYTTYQGSSYWGSATTFKFNADKSVLNVILDNGDIYVYKRTSPPAGVTTCSLIRKKQSGGGATTGGYYPPIIYPPVQQYPQGQYQQQQYQQPQTPTQTRTQQQQPTRTKCVPCDGTGEIIKEDGFSLGLGTKYCDKCKKAVSSDHYHAPCPYCHGNGYQ